MVSTIPVTDNNSPPTLGAVDLTMREAAFPPTPEINRWSPLAEFLDTKLEPLRALLDPKTNREMALRHMGLTSEEVATLLYHLVNDPPYTARALDVHLPKLFELADAACYDLGREVYGGSHRAAQTFSWCEIAFVAVGQGLIGPEARTANREHWAALTNNTIKTFEGLAKRLQEAGYPEYMHCLNSHASVLKARCEWLLSSSPELIDKSEIVYELISRVASSPK